MRKGGVDKRRDISQEKGAMRGMHRFLSFANNDKKIALISFVAVAVLLGNLILAPMAQAAKNYSEMTPADRAKSVWYYDALKYCFQNHDIGGAVSSGGVDKGDFFTKGVGHNTTVKGAIVGNELPNGDKDFTYGCKENESEIVRNAFSLWGISPKEFLCESGIAAGSSSTGQACATSPSIVSESSAKRAAKFDNYVTNAVFGGKAPTTVSAADPEVAYIYNLKTFDNACATGKNANGNGVKIVRRQADGVSKSEVYYDINKTKTIPYSNTVNMTCENLAATLAPDSGLVNGYFAWAEGEKMLGNGDMLAGDVANSAEDTGATGEDNNACQVEGIGWIVCPVMTTLGMITDSAYEAVADLLKFEPQLLTDNSLKAAHGAFLNIANAGFVIVFIIVIYAQLTGAGLTSIGATYQLKKIAPRLVIAAILVNLSYYISTIVVDVSNIVGANIGGLIEAIPSSAGSGGHTPIAGFGQGLGIGVVVVGVLAIGVGIALAVTFPVLLAALLSILMILLILMGRKAAIIILIVVSPLAFLAWVLPNTDQWFKRWWKTLGTLLLLYPIVSIVFSGSQLAANIVANVGGGTGDEQFDWMIQATAVGIATVPFFVVPSLLKGALSGLGTVGGKLSGLTDKATGRVGDKVKTQSRLGDVVQNRKFRSAEKRARRRAGRGFVSRQGQRILDSRTAASGGVKGALAKTAGRATQFVGGGGSSVDNSWIGRKIGLDRGAATASGIVDEMYEKDVKNAGLLFTGMTSGAVIRAAMSGEMNGTKMSEVQRTAAVDYANSKGGFAERAALLGQLASEGGDSKPLMRRAVDSAYAKGDSEIYGNNFGDKVIDGTIKNEADLKNAIVSNFAKGGVSSEQIVVNPGRTEYAKEAIKSASTSNPDRADAVSSFRKAATGARFGESTKGKVNPDSALDKTFKDMGV